MPPPHYYYNLLFLSLMNDPCKPLSCHEASYYVTYKWLLMTNHQKQNLLSVKLQRSKKVIITFHPGKFSSEKKNSLKFIARLRSIKLISSAAWNCSTRYIFNFLSILRIGEAWRAVAGQLVDFGGPRFVSFEFQWNIFIIIVLENKKYESSRLRAAHKNVFINDHIYTFYEYLIGIPWRSFSLAQNILKKIILL